MNAVGLGVFGILVLVMWFLAVVSYFENNEIWNKGICAKNGEPWEVQEVNGTLWLFAGNEHHLVRGIMVPGAIYDALKADREKPAAA